MFLTSAKVLIASAEATTRAVQASTGGYFLPGEQGNGRAAIARHLTALYPSKETLQYKSGVICLSEDERASIYQLNKAKSQFKDAVMSLRISGVGEKSRIDKLIERAAQNEGRRSDDLLLALRELNIQHFDLLHCYRQIRILPKGIRSISWTWARKHTSIVRIRTYEAIEMAKALDSELAREAALLELDKLQADEPLALKKTLPNQLRANIVWEEGGELIRKMVTASGIFISQDTHIPQCRWRDDPGASLDQDRKIRTDLTIGDEPYIKALNLYRYQ